MPLMEKCEWWDLMFCDEKFYGGIILSVVKIIMIERSAFESKWVILWLYSMIVEML